MALKATLQTKLACAALTIIVVNIALLIAIIAFVSMDEMCTIYSNEVHIHDMTWKGQVPNERLHPWLLVYMIFPDTFVGCGAIVSKNWALTTSHCANAANTHPISRQVFRGGSTRWDKYGHYHFVTKIIRSKELAVAEVSPQFLVNTFEAPVALSSRYFNALNDVCLFGWVKQHFLTQTRSMVKRDKIAVVSKDLCKENILKSNRQTYFCGSTFNCTEYPKYTFVSGSLLIQNDTLIGMVLEEAPCDENGRQIIYVNIGDTVEWLLKKQINESISIKIES